VDSKKASMCVCTALCESALFVNMLLRVLLQGISVDFGSKLL